MKKFIKNYKSSLIIFLSLIIGLIIGLIFKEKAIYLAPFGKLFINLFFKKISIFSKGTNFLRHNCNRFH